jgi:DtxR family Mn-dependent transcriptional regulator
LRHDEPGEPIEPLSRLSSGETGRVVHILAREASRLVKLSAMGVVPGAAVRVVQRKPAVVIAVGETTLALDAAITSEIYVVRVVGPGEGRGGRTR